MMVRTGINGVRGQGGLPMDGRMWAKSLICVRLRSITAT